MSRLIEKLENDEEFDQRLIVTGTHLSKRFGYTFKEIKQKITEKIDIEIEKSSPHAISLAIKKFSKAFIKFTPDIIIILGDRYEILGVAIAAMLNKIPIAHIHGGELSEGAFDDSIRHSITKMSHFHFTSCDEYKVRVIQLGESPKRVFNVGALGVENIYKKKLLNKKELEKSSTLNLI